MLNTYLMSMSSEKGIKSLQIHKLVVLFVESQHQSLHIAAREIHSARFQSAGKLAAGDETESLGVLRTQRVHHFHFRHIGAKNATTQFPNNVCVLRIANEHNKVAVAEVLVAADAH